MRDNYHDIDGNKVPLDTLCRKEPAWAANVIRTLKAELARYKAGVEVTGHVSMQECGASVPGLSAALLAYPHKVRVLVMKKEGI